MYLFARITNSRPNRLGSENKYLNMATWFDFNSIPNNSQRNKEKRQSPKGSNGGDIFIVECKREQKLHVFGDNNSSYKKRWQSKPLRGSVFASQIPDNLLKIDIYLSAISNFVVCFNLQRCLLEP